MPSVESASTLPAQPTQLIGRTREVFALRELVLREDVRLVSITGTAGIGKTRLAIATAVTLQSSFSDGATFVDLSTISDSALWGQSPYGRYLSHHSLDELRGGGSLMLVFVAGWLVMLVAMMLPTSLPLVMLFHTLVEFPCPTMRT